MTRPRLGPAASRATFALLPAPVAGRAKALLGLVLGALLATSAVAAEGYGRIEGTVVAADTGQPFAGVGVGLMGMLSDGTGIQPTRTDEQGRFVFDHLPANSQWWVTAGAPPDSLYVSAYFWDFGIRGDAVEVVVKPMAVTRVTVRLLRGGGVFRPQRPA